MKNRNKVAENILIKIKNDKKKYPYKMMKIKNKH